MFYAALLALVVAVAVVSVPRLLYRLALGVTWPMASFKGWAAQTFLAVLLGEFIVCARGLAFGEEVGGLVVAAAVVYFGAGTLRARRLQAAFRGLLDPGKRDASLAFIERDLGRRRTRAERSTARYQGYARTALVVGTTLEGAGLTSAAIHAIEQIDESLLPALMRAMRAQNLAALLIRNGEREAAHRVLTRVRRPVPDPDYEDAIAALEALLLVLEGDAEQGEARARPALERTKSPPVLATWQAVLAHALAAHGARDEATTVLEQMRASLGEIALTRVVRQRGPASPIAESLQAVTGVPYR